MLEESAADYCRDAGTSLGIGTLRSIVVFAVFVYTIVLLMYLLLN
jgi:hypothetical protein